MINLKIQSRLYFTICMNHFEEIKKKEKDFMKDGKKWIIYILK